MRKSRVLRIDKNIKNLRHLRHPRQSDSKYKFSDKLGKRDFYVNLCNLR